MKIITTVEHELHYCPNTISLLVKGNYDSCDSRINDDHFSYCTDKTGVVMVKFCFIPGEHLKREDNVVYLSDVMKYFREHGMRRSKPAEALLPPAKDKQLGDEHQYIALVQNSHNAFGVNRDNRGRHLRWVLAWKECQGCGGLWDPNSIFVGVCE